MELGHWVTGSMSHLGHLSRPGHRVIILTRCKTRVFPVFEKMPKIMQILLFGAGYKYSYLLTLSSTVLQYSIRYSTEYSSSKKLDSHTPTATHQSTFGVHYRAGSPGQLGLRVAGSPSHWVAGSQNVTQFHLCSKHRPTASDKDD